MGLSVKGYILDPPRVGGSNAPFTMTPNVYIFDQAAFDAAYPSDESAPRTEYCVFVLVDPKSSGGTGPGGNGSLVDARFVWTKNEVIQRFDYEGAEGRFKPLPGSPLILVGPLGPISNTERLKVLAPSTTDLLTCPIRVSVGTGSGTTFTVVLVQTDAGFGSPAPGEVQLSIATGNLHWNVSDLTTFAGQNVRYQRQSFYSYRDSSGALGVITDPLLLNPLPGANQYPLLRIGFGEYLTPVARADEAGFSVDPSPSTVEWARTTGRLKFNHLVTLNNTGKQVYYDGVVFAWDLAVQTVSVGTVVAPSSLWPLPPEASDTFFRISNVTQFPETQFVDTLTSPGKKNVVQIRRSDGSIRFSSTDQAQYGSAPIEAVMADLLIERGLKLRLFRTPVNLDAADASLQDVSAFYASSDAIWAKPIIGAPMVDLPAIPVDTRYLQVKVLQGTGSYTSNNLPRLDAPSPPIGLGYILNYDAKQLLFAERKVNQVIPAATAYGGVQLPDPLVFESNLSLEVETTPGSGIYAPLVVGESALVDFPSGLVTLVATEGVVRASGSDATFLGATLTDLTTDFGSAGVSPGNRLVAVSGPSKGVYTVSAVGTSSLTTDVPGAPSTGTSYSIHDGVEILADRYFYEVPPVDPNTKVERIRVLGPISNGPRLMVDPSQIGALKFRFGKDTFSTLVVAVLGEGYFTDPSLMLAGEVEVAQDTGRLNFSQIDVSAGGLVYSVRTLVLGRDYALQPPLGFVQLTERLLQSEECRVTYKTSDGTVLQERATFLVRKEKLDHPVPTSTLSFNSAGLEVAASPAPKAYRGGRPQSTSQVQVDTLNSTITFIETPTVTKALPSGPIVEPSESVYLDYYVYEAVGGEQNFTVLQPPMQGVAVRLAAEANDFYLAGDLTGPITPEVLLLVDSSELYQVASATYDFPNQRTHVVLAAPQVFLSSFTNPKLAVSSGPIRVTGSPLAPSYFLTELSSYEDLARGATVIHVLGDVSRTYLSGTVLLFSTDFYLVSGSVYNKATGKTDVTLTTETFRQYIGVPLKRSVRPVLEKPSASLATLRSPMLEQTFVLYRRVSGFVGELLSTPEDYTVDASGVVTLSNPLEPNEEIGALYTGASIIEAGRAFRASYTFGVAPTETNGLLNQTLAVTYTTYAPDSFFWRVETFTNFRGELAEAYSDAAKASVPTAGPVLENSSQPTLFEQGRASIYYEEGYLSNEDLIARPTLRYYNDAINYLENILQYLDGRVVGDHDGRFLFDGSIDNPYRTTFASVTNQIDDTFRVSPAPYAVSGPPFVVTSIGTYQEVFRPAASSRFYPTQRSRFGTTVSGVAVGDPILDIGIANLTSVAGIQRRAPWAMVLARALLGTTTLIVDAAEGDLALLRPAFTHGMRVAVIAQDGTVLVSDAASLTVSGVGPSSLTLDPVPVEIPRGATVRLATNDSTYRKSYRLGVDLAVDPNKGLLTYLDTTDPVWSLLNPSSPNTGEVLDTSVTLNNALTAPDRFPALDGHTTDDDGNRGFPILTPSIASEVSAVGYLPEELRVINATTGTLPAIIVPPLVRTGSLDGTGTIITNITGLWPSPVPRLYDLVDIRTGPNAPSDYRIIISVGASTITVNAPFAFPNDPSFTFTVAVSTSPASGVATIAPNTHLQDPTANFLAMGVQAGHTVIITTGVLTGLRRQVVAILSPTELTIEALPNTGSFGYRISNSLATYGRVPESITERDWVPALIGLANILSLASTPLAEVPSFEAFFNTVFSDVAVGSNGLSAASTFSSVGQTFLSSVSTSDFLFIPSGALAGVYRLQSVDTDESLTIVGSFPISATDIEFRVVSTLGLSAESLSELLNVLHETEVFLASSLAALSLLTSAVPVSGDAGAHATRLLGTSLIAREGAIISRISQASSAIDVLTNELAYGDKLYDKRYVWIDSRINLTGGILTKRERAVLNRHKAQQEVLAQLTKLLSVKT